MAGKNQLDLSMQPNTLYYGDCWDVMTLWPDACVNLIYLDPPFNSDANYNILFGRKKGKYSQVTKRKDLAQMTAFSDTWEWSEKTAERIAQIKKSVGHKARNSVMALDRFFKDGNGMLAYLIYMADRINEMHRILKDDGSIYLHCDPTASHYLKMIMDDVFGAQNFRNEIVWIRKQDTHNLASKHAGKVHDVIFWYAKSSDTKYNKQFVDYSEDYINTAYKHEDKRGRYRTLPCTNETGGNKPYKFRGITRAWRFKKTRMQQMFDDDWLVQSTPTSPFQYKKYLDGADGVPIQDVWADIKAVRGKNESLGYPTQKPLALLDRIIKASSDKGDVVLDPFCGCGTTIEAAMKLKRKFIGIDISFYALEVIQKERMKNAKFVVKGVPFDLDAAKDMATKHPFVFEKWAVHLVPGFLSNTKQTGDGGVDGRAGLFYPPQGEEGMCYVQVKGGTANVNDLKALLSQISGGYASVGLFITMEKWDTPTVKKCIADAGKLQHGATSYNRLVMWSIEEYFASDKKMPNLPPLAHPITGNPLQEDLLMRK